MSDRHECVGPDWCPYDEEVVRNLAADTAVQGEKIDRIEQGIQRIETCLKGNGKEGLVVRTDRLEQKDKTRGRIFWIALTGIIGLALKTIAEAAGWM